MTLVDILMMKSKRMKKGQIEQGEGRSEMRGNCGVLPFFPFFLFPSLFPSFFPSFSFSLSASFTCCSMNFLKSFMKPENEGAAIEEDAQLRQREKDRFLHRQQRIAEENAARTELLQQEKDKLKQEKRVEEQRQQLVKQEEREQRRQRLQLIAQQQQRDKDEEQLQEAQQQPQIQEQKMQKMQKIQKQLQLQQQLQEDLEKERVFLEAKIEASRGQSDGEPLHSSS